MRRLILYLKQCFCNHKFEYEEVDLISVKTRCDGSKIKIEERLVSVTCKKCNYHKSYKKFD